jgi:hypothetical protein
MQVRHNTTVCSSLSCQGHEADHVPLKQDDVDVVEHHKPKSTHRS